MLGSAKIVGLDPPFCAPMSCQSCGSLQLLCADGQLPVLDKTASCLPPETMAVMCCPLFCRSTASCTRQTTRWWRARCWQWASSTVACKTRSTPHSPCCQVCTCKLSLLGGAAGGGHGELRRAGQVESALALLSGEQLGSVVVARWDGASVTAGCRTRSTLHSPCCQAGAVGLGSFQVPAEAAAAASRAGAPNPSLNARLLHVFPSGLQTTSARTTPRRGSAPFWAWALRTPAGKSSNAWRAGDATDALLRLCGPLAVVGLAVA